MNIIKILTLASLTGTALMGGVFYAFSTAIMGSLQRMPTGQGAAAMNLISARIQNPLFLLIFIGTALVSLALAVLAFADPVLAERYRQLAAGVAVYSAHADGERRLRLHAAEVSPATQAAALRLDPITDRDEYAALAAFLASDPAERPVPG